MYWGGGACLTSLRDCVCVPPPIYRVLQPEHSDALHRGATVDFLLEHFTTTAAAAAAATTGSGGASSLLSASSLRALATGGYLVIEDEIVFGADDMIGLNPLVAMTLRHRPGIR